MIAIDATDEATMAMKPEFLLFSRQDATVLSGQCMQAALIKIVLQTFPYLGQGMCSLLSIT